LATPEIADSDIAMALSGLRAILVWSAAGVFATGALAQTANYTTVEATAGKPTQLGYYGSAGKNCTPAPVPTVRVVEAPKSGTLTVRQGALTTNRIAGCPALKTSVEVVFYQARGDYSGRDHVSYEVTNSNGDVGDYDVTIEVKAAPKTAAPSASGSI